MIDGWVRKETKSRDKWLLRRVKKIKIRTIIILFLIFAILSLIFLRVNNMNMAGLRMEVYAADKTGQIAKVEQAALNLRNYVSNHMNTDTGLISLQTMYNNAVAEATKRANSKIDSAIYTKADKKCRSLIYQKGYSAYVQCVANAIGSTKFVEPTLPDPALFYLSFSSPLLTADLAGVVTVIAVLLFIIIAVRAITEVILRIVVKIKKAHP